ncbi:hypothetical protein SMICM17S_10275 [Streptomyces microflavus]
MPLYGSTPLSPVISRLVFWISKLSRFFPFFSSPGKSADAVAAYSRKSFFCMPLRAISVRS